jgi:hypothetical protein
LRTLALAAGEGARLAGEEGLDGEDAGRFLHALLDLVLGRLTILQAVGHVVVDAHMRIERIVLEHHRDVAVGRLDLVHDPVADLHLAAGNRLKACDHAKKRGLAAAGRADQHAEGAVLDAERDALHGFHVARIDLPDRIEGDPCHRSVPFDHCPRRHGYRAKISMM